MREPSAGATSDAEGRASANSGEKSSHEFPVLIVEENVRALTDEPQVYVDCGNKVTVCVLRRLAVSTKFFV